MAYKLHNEQDQWNDNYSNKLAFIMARSKKEENEKI
jgi:hypothetical protein